MCRAVSSDLSVVEVSETDVAVPLNSPKTPLQTSSTTLSPLIKRVASFHS